MSNKIEYSELSIGGITYSKVSDIEKEKYFFEKRDNLKKIFMLDDGTFKLRMLFSIFLDYSNIEINLTMSHIEKCNSMDNDFRNIIDYINYIKILINKYLSLIKISNFDQTDIGNNLSHFENKITIYKIEEYFSKKSIILKNIIIEIFDMKNDNKKKSHMLFTILERVHNYYISLIICHMKTCIEVNSNIKYFIGDIKKSKYGINYHIIRIRKIQENGKLKDTEPKNDIDMRLLLHMN